MRTYDKEKRRQYYLNRIEKAKAECKIYREKHKEEYRKKTIEFRRKNPDFCKNWYKKNKEKCLKYNRAWRKNNKEKIIAHSALNIAVNKGIITRGICSNCGEKNTQAHHHDYSKPLDVIWLCRSCHTTLHFK